MASPFQREDLEQLGRDAVEVLRLRCPELVAEHERRGWPLHRSLIGFTTMPLSGGRWVGSLRLVSTKFWRRWIGVVWRCRRSPDFE